MNPRLCMLLEPRFVEYKRSYFLGDKNDLRLYTS